MNLFQLIFKQLRQRSLSTVLTILSVALGVGLATTILIFQREGDKLFGQSDFGFDIVLGPKGSALELVLNNVYHTTNATSTIPYGVYTDLTHRLARETRWAMPMAMGDNYRGHRLIATLPKMFETKEFANVRQNVRDKADTLRSIVGALRDERQTPTLPLPARSPELPKLFALQQSLRTLAVEAEAFDPEARVALERAAAAASAFLDQLSTAAERAAIVAGGDALLADVSQAAALLGGPIQSRVDQPFELASGRAFAHDKFEVVVGSEVVKKLGLKIGDQISAEHGTQETTSGDHHDEKWTVVGILKPSFTAFDRLLFIPLTSFYAIPVHEEAMSEMSKKTEEYKRLHGGDQPAPPTTAAANGGEEVDPHADNNALGSHYDLRDGHIVLNLPKSDWKLSSILVKSRMTQTLLWDYRQTPDAMAVNPATEMRTFTDTFLRGSTMLLLLLAVLVSVVAAVSILVSIYNSIAARRREIAILRALGATRNRILSIICLEAGMIGLIGSICGLALGMALAAIGSVALKQTMGQGINWFHISPAELLYLAGAVVLSILSGLVPALKAYSTPVATNLSGE